MKGKNLGDSHANEIVRSLKAQSILKSLDLGSNKFTDDGVQLIAKAVHETEIQTLILSNNKLTDKCTETLAAIFRTNKHLKLLDLQGNNITNRVARNKLKNSLTTCEVKF